MELIIVIKYLFCDCNVVLGCLCFLLGFCYDVIVFLVGFFIWIVVVVWCFGLVWGWVDVELFVGVEFEFVFLLERVIVWLF